MSEPLSEYAETLSSSANPDSIDVRGIVQLHEADAEFQDTVIRLNDLYAFQKERALAKGEKKAPRSRKKKS